MIIFNDTILSIVFNNLSIYEVSIFEVCKKWNNIFIFRSNIDFGCNKEHK